MGSWELMTRVPSEWRKLKPLGALATLPTVPSRGLSA